jgi:P-type Cu+ transporter
MNTQLVVDGMTCASCAARIEKRLNRIDGVEATVNYATARAAVTHGDGVAPEALVSAVESAGYSAHLPSPEPGEDDDRQRRQQKRRLIVCALLALPVLVLGMVPDARFTGWTWVSLVFATPVALWGAWSFHRATWQNLRHGATTMDTLVSIGVLAAYVWSVVAVIVGGDLYFEVASVVTVFLLTGRYLETRARHESGAALQALMQQGAKDVAVITDGIERRIPIGALAVGELFVVRPGEKVATDGVVVEGTSAIDASLLTGEAVPVEVAPESAVVGATVNAGGRLIVRATRVGADTQLAQMGRLVEQAQEGKTQAQRLADRVSGVFVPVVLVLSLVTFGVWCLSGAAVSSAFVAAVSVLIVACPCALGLATPTALLVGTGRAAQLGILIRGPQVLESTRVVDTVVLDKTGTVTTGHMSLVDVFAADGVDADELLRATGTLEAASAHPVALAIADAARAHGLAKVENFVSTAGLGVEGDVEGRHVVAGRRTWVEKLAAAGVSGQLATELDAAQAVGRTVVAVAWDGVVVGGLTVSDTAKATSAEAVRTLRSLGLRPVLLTGDNGHAAASIARAVGIDDVISDVLPAGKADAIRALQAQGHVVAMVGDGVNDAAALAQADLGIAMGAGSDVAIAASDLTLVTGDLRAAGDAVRLSRATLRIIKGNLFWAFAYNLAALPLAAFGLLNPMIAGGAMAFSSVFVVTNSLRLRRFR